MAFNNGIVTVGADSAPPGSYQAEFKGWERFDENEDKFGPGISLKFLISQGEQKDKVVTRIVSQKTGPKSNLFKFLTALKGAKPEAGEEIRIDDFCGVKGQVIVEETESGATRVSVFLRDA
jgi:hypothetical protein